MFCVLNRVGETAALKAKICGPRGSFQPKAHLEKKAVFAVKTYSKAFNLIVTVNQCYFSAYFVIFWFKIVLFY